MNSLSANETYPHRKETYSYSKRDLCFFARQRTCSMNGLDAVIARPKVEGEEGGGGGGRFI
jgi:hypothetical protein